MTEVSNRRLLVVRSSAQAESSRFTSTQLNYEMELYTFIAGLLNVVVVVVVRVSFTKTFPNEFMLFCIVNGSPLNVACNKINLCNVKAEESLHVNM